MTKENYQVMKGQAINNDGKKAKLCLMVEIDSYQVVRITDDEEVKTNKESNLDDNLKT